MAEFLGNTKRTDYCGTVTEAKIGETVTVMGWVAKQRDLGSIIFIDLRDRSGIVQIALDETSDKEVFAKAAAARSEYGISLLIVSISTSTFCIIQQRPTTTKRLKRLEPDTLLIARELLPAIDAEIETAVSGRDVPIATIVRPMISDGTLNLFATFDAPSTKKSAPLMRPTNPTTKRISAPGIV